MLFCQRSMSSPWCTTVSPGIKSHVAAAAARRRRWERLKLDITGSCCSMWCDAWHRKTSSRRFSGNKFNRFASLACHKSEHLITIRYWFFPILFKLKKKRGRKKNEMMRIMENHGVWFRHMRQNLKLHQADRFSAQFFTSENMMNGVLQSTCDLVGSLASCGENHDWLHRICLLSVFQHIHRSH